MSGTDTVIQKLEIPHGQVESTSSPYDVLRDYYIYLLELNKSKKPVSINTIRWRVNTAKDFIESMTDRELSTKRFKNKVNYGILHEREPEALTRDNIIKLLTTTYDTRLRVFIHFLVSVGCRPIEACRLKLSNLDFDSNPSKVHFPASITKIKKARTNQLTKEITQRLKVWHSYKYRTRNKVTLVGNGDDKTFKTQTERITPEPNERDLLFAISQDVNPDSIYTELAKHFRRLLEITDSDDKYEDGIHKITFGSFRDYVKTQISNATNSDFSEYFIGHKGKYNYYVNDVNTATELFKSVEPRLTFFDKDEVLEIAKDTESKISVHRDEIKSLKERLSITEKILSKIQEGEPTIPVRQRDGTVRNMKLHRSDNISKLLPSFYLLPDSTDKEIVEEFVSGLGRDQTFKLASFFKKCEQDRYKHAIKNKDKKLIEEAAHNVNRFGKWLKILNSEIP